LHGTMRFHSVLVIFFGIATSERSADPEEAEDQEDEPDPNSHVALEKLKEFYHPQYGAVHLRLQNIAKAQQDATSAARTWTGNSFQALKEAHMFMTKNTQETQNVLMSDTMRVNDAIRYNFKDEMAKIDAMSLNETARKKIQAEKGLSVVMPPGEFKNEFNGRRIRANTVYSREYAAFVHNREGTIIDYIEEEACWTVKFDGSIDALKSETVPVEWKPCLREGEFEFIAETSAKRAREHKPERPSTVLASHMGEFTQDPYVIVDHIPLKGTPRVAGKQWLHRICKVVSWDTARNAYKVKRPLDPDNYMSSLYSDEALYLLPNRDFHSFHDIAGQKVQITHFKQAKPGLPGEAFYGRGQVLSFDPAKMMYKVKIPSQTLELTPKEIIRLRRNVLTKWIWTRDAEEDRQLKKFYLDHHEAEPKEGAEITTSQIALLVQREHQNMESIAINSERPLVQKISESGEGSWSQKVRDQMARAADTDIDFAQFRWTHQAANAFEELNTHVFPLQPARQIKTALIRELLYWLPANSLDLRLWFGTNKLYKCGHQPYELPGLYVAEGRNVKCTGTPLGSTTTNPDCEKQCTDTANCFFYALSSKSGLCEMWELHACPKELEAADDETLFTYRRQAWCLNENGVWKSGAESRTKFLDHSGEEPLLAISRETSLDDVKADISKYEDLFGSARKTFPTRGDETTLPWYITVKGLEVLTKLKAVLPKVKQGEALTTEIVKEILSIPGMDMEEWFHDEHPFVVGPNDWDEQVYKEEKAREEYTDPQDLVEPSDDAAAIKKKIVIFHLRDEEWKTGVIKKAQIDSDKKPRTELTKLGDYEYQIAEVDANGQGLAKPVVHDHLRWRTNWFDPRGKWKNEGYEGMVAYKEWDKAQAGGDSSLLQVGAHGSFIRQHHNGP